MNHEANMRRINPHAERDRGNDHLWQVHAQTILLVTPTRHMQPPPPPPPPPLYLRVSAGHSGSWVGASPTGRMRGYARRPCVSRMRCTS